MFANVNDGLMPSQITWAEIILSHYVFENQLKLGKVELWKNWECLAWRKDWG